MLYDEDHFDFEIKLKRYVHLEVLLGALERDKKQLGHLKMGEVYEYQIDQIIEKIQKDMEELRHYFRRSKGKILQIMQLPGERLVEYVFDGYRLKVKYLNEFMKVECGEILKSYMKLKRGGPF